MCMFAEQDVLNTVARARGGVGHTPGFTMITTPRARCAAVKPGVPGTPGTARGREARGASPGSERRVSVLLHTIDSVGRALRPRAVGACLFLAPPLHTLARPVSAMDTDEVNARRRWCAVRGARGPRTATDRAGRRSVSLFDNGAPS